MDIYQAMGDVFGYPQSEMTLRHGGTCELRVPVRFGAVLADGKDDGTVVDPAMASATHHRTAETHHPHPAPPQPPPPHRPHRAAAVLHPRR